jgi:4a-hydroxytetrahydrobiopterin dehydratase
MVIPRDFLDALAALSEETGVHPQNINFGTTYVNVTLEGAEGSRSGRTGVHAGRDASMR